LIIEVLPEDAQREPLIREKGSPIYTDARLSPERGQIRVAPRAGQLGPCLHSHSTESKDQHTQQRDLP
jgi:hypothetical protein